MLSTLTLLPLAFTLLFAASAPTLPRTGPDGKIHLQNPSFEDAPQQSAAPHGWQYFSPGSTPDIQPGIWGVQMAAQEGSTYVGLVAREDGTTEDVGQTLREDLLGGVCYEFSIYLAHSPKYAGYNHPLRLQVWGAASKGAKEQLLASSPLINHAEWKAYKLQFVPSRTLRYITLQAWYGPGVLFKYKGNILLDNCSPIERCDRA
ncbi:MAG TPA: hypothetical protein PK971_07555 [Saprospiraceae bacterium]|nr:hypothetical protein [Saprospiraceae bacterium]